jgi:hypothetical protein
MTGAARPVATGHAGRLRHPAGLPALGPVVHHRTRGARNGLPAALAGGTLHPPAPAVCLLDGLPPRRLHGQGSLRAHECSLGLRPPLDRSGVEPARRDPVARGGRGATPDQQARGEDRGGPPRNPHPRRHLLAPSTRKEVATDPDHHRDRPASTIPSPEEGTHA